MNKREEVVRDSSFSLLFGVGKSSLLLRFADGAFTTSFISTIGIDFKKRIVELDGRRIMLQVWDTAGKTVYFRGAMRILLLYDVTDKSSFNNIRNWIRSMQQLASDNVNMILALPTSKGLLAGEYGIQFFETQSTIRINQDQAAGTGEAAQKSACRG
ncbi:hypothetical protein K1719_036202 [Acacia pycnantha]|nr:hypothetical protein K1719_036202 [Acacia pycnantha]